MPDTTALSADIIARLVARHLTIAVAESITGGLLVAELIRTPGASAVVNGGVVAYNSELKRSLLGVDAELLAAHGAIHPDVAVQMATGVRTVLAVAGTSAQVGISTTGVAGPDEQDGQAVGTVFLGFAIGARTYGKALSLSGDRDTIRSTVVSESLLELARLLG